MSHLETKWCHGVLAPRHETFVFEMYVTAIKNPYLLTERTWNRLLHKEGWTYFFIIYPDPNALWVVFMAVDIFGFDQRSHLDQKPGV
jgi:hypothetical protein